jgi:2'-5' RNA ligase
VALDIPAEVRAAVAALVVKLRPSCRNARWVRTEGAHITLKFIGEVPPEKTKAIEAALAPIQTPAPIEMNFRGVGFFPNDRHPHVFWELSELAAAVESSLEPLGIAREQRAFSPHLTLARLESPRGLDALRAAIAWAGPVEFGRTTAREFHLYQSILKPSGAEYTRLAAYPFAGSRVL